MPTFPVPAFTSIKSTSSYIFNQSDFQSEFKSKDNLIFPVVHDSEWTGDAMRDFLHSEKINSRDHISTQIKHIFHNPVCFFTEYSISETGYDWLTPFKKDFIACDYLDSMGIDSDIRESENESDKALPYFDCFLYSFFGLVDITLLGSPIFNKVIGKLINDEKIKHSKRVTTQWEKPVNTELLISLTDSNNEVYEYQLRLKFIDIGALHGNASYKTVCENVGIDTSKKSLMDDYKSDMLTGLKLYPQDFIEYANGDLFVYDILVKNAEYFRLIYQELEIGEYYQLPKLTIGSTVANIFESAVFKWREILPSSVLKPKDKKNVLSELAENSSADYLRTQTSSKTYLLGKVHGGRCRNNKPLIFQDIGTIADSDLKGAYASLMAMLPYIVGKAWIYEGDSISLSDFLKRYENDFDDYHYAIVVRTDTLLDIPQDLLVSWLAYTKQKPERMKLENGDRVDLADYTLGECRILKNQVINGIVNTHIVKWIRTLAPKSRNGLMNKLMVITAIGYRKKDKDKEWYSKNLGELLINPLRDKRAFFQKRYKETNDKTDYSIQQLFKLVINTIYGDMCSRFFPLSNVLVANNITQGTRLAVYLMEKGLNMQCSITDGGIVNLNKVLYPRGDRQVLLDHTVDLYRCDSIELQKRHFRLAPLDNAKHIELTFEKTDCSIHLAVLTVEYTDKTIIIKDKLIYVKGKPIRKTIVNDWINQKTHNHLMNLFPDFHYLLNHLAIELKDVYSEYTFYSAANYRLVSPNNINRAMRAYSEKHQTVGLSYDTESNQVIENEFYTDTSVSEKTLAQLGNRTVKKLPPFARVNILKSKDFQNRKFYDRSELACGDNTIEIGMPNYFSLTQFTYQNVNQYIQWKRGYEKLKSKYGESYEVYFTEFRGNEEILHIEKMMQVIEKMIFDGVKNPLTVLSKNYPINPLSKNSERYRIKKLASESRNVKIFIYEENDDCTELPD